MASKRLVKVGEWLAQAGITSIGFEQFRQLCDAFPEIQESILRKLVRETELPLAPLVEGVRQEDFQSLGRTLIALQHEYLEGGERARAARALVLTAKVHAGFAARKKPEKTEMIQWMLVWLENPGLFETWYTLRMARVGTPENTGTAEDHVS